MDYFLGRRVTDVQNDLILACSWQQPDLRRGSGWGGGSPCFFVFFKYVYLPWKINP